MGLTRAAVGIALVLGAVSGFVAARLMESPPAVVAGVTGDAPVSLHSADAVAEYAAQAPQAPVDSVDMDAVIRAAIREELAAYFGSQDVSMDTLPVVTGQNPEMPLTPEEDRLYREVRRRFESALTAGEWRQEDEAQLESMMGMAAIKAPVRDLILEVTRAKNNGLLRR